MNHKAGFTLLETVIATLALSAVALAATRLVTELRRNEKVAFDDLLQLAENRLFAQVLRNDFIRIAPSIGVVKIAPDDFQAADPDSFFDFNSSLGCNEDVRGCGRTLTLDGSTGKSEMVFLIDPQGSDGGSMLYKTTHAYLFDVATSTYTYKGINFLGNISFSSTPLYSGFNNGSLYLLKAMTSMAFRLGSPPQDQCQCPTQAPLVKFTSCSADCSGANAVPYFTPSAFVGYARGIPSDQKGGDLVALSGDVAKYFRYTHPSDPSLLFGSTPQIFIETLPGAGDVESYILIKPVQMIRYRIDSKRNLTRTAWNTTLKDFDSNPVTIATRVKKLVLRRPSISLNFVSFSVEQERSQ